MDHAIWYEAAANNCTRNGTALKLPNWLCAASKWPEVANATVITARPMIRMKASTRWMRWIQS